MTNSIIGSKKARLSVALSIAIVLSLMISSSTTVLAQSGDAMVEGESQTQTQTTYKTAYQKMTADSDSSVTVQSKHHLYNLGEQVTVQGSMSSEAREEAESDSVAVTLMDASGTVVADQAAQVDSNGEYSATFTLPQDAEEGEYTLDSKVEISASILGALDAEIVAKMQSSTTFVVASSTEFEVMAEGDAGAETFSVDIASNSNVNNFQFSQEEKKVSFVVEGETGTSGVTQITIPKAMLSGEMMVSIDGQVVTSQSDDVIITSDTETEMTLEINYSHSEHNVDVTGTNVVPEFPMSIVIMTAALGSIVAVLAVGRRKGFIRT